MPKLQDMETELASVRTELDRLADIQDPSDEDVVFQETLIAEHNRLMGEITPIRERMAALKEIRRVAADEGNREPTDPERSPIEAPQAMFVRSGIDKDPFKDVSAEALMHNRVTASELRARSAALIERDENRHELDRERAEAAYSRSQGMGAEPGTSKHIMLTGTEEYREAFRAFLTSPVDTRQYEGKLLSDVSSRGIGAVNYRAINLTNASGGFLLPYILDPTIVLTNNASANPYRRVSRIVQTTSNAWQGVNSAGVTAAWVAEAATAADMSPTVGQIQIVPEKAVAWVLGSYEALDDTNFGEQLPGLLSDAKDRLESAAFSTGAGTASSQPLGILQASGITRVAPGATGTAFQSSTASTGGMADVMNLQAKLPPRFRQSSSAAYLANINQLNRIRQVDVYGGAQFWTNLTTNTPAALVGQPVYEASDLPSATTGTSAASGTGSATLVYGDWAQYIICDRVGVSMLYDPMLKGTGNAQLPTGQAGWYMFWRVGSQVSTGAAFYYLTIS